MKHTHRQRDRHNLKFINNTSVFFTRVLIYNPPNLCYFVYQVAIFGAKYHRGISESAYKRSLLVFSLNEVSKAVADVSSVDYKKKKESQEM